MTSVREQARASGESGLFVIAIVIAPVSAATRAAWTISNVRPECEIAMATSRLVQQRGAGQGEVQIGVRPRDDPGTMQLLLEVERREPARGRTVDVILLVCAHSGDALLQLVDVDLTSGALDG